MFMPCPNCGFLVALIAGRETSQRCPRCGSALVEAHDAADVPQAAPQRRVGEQRADTPAQVPAPPERARAPDDAPTPRESREPRIDTVATIDRIDTATATPALSATDMDDELDARIDVETDAGSDTDLDMDDAAQAEGPTAPLDAAAAVAPPVAASHDGPSFVRRRRTRPRGRRWPLATAVGLLAVLFALQLLLAQRQALAADARWRPLVMQACGVLGCDVPAWREPQAYRMLARNVRPNPRKPGVLHVTATVRNDAHWPQPAPVIVLSLSDLDGRLVGARAVAPREYGQRVAALVAPGDSLDVAFDVREPASRVESYDFQLQ